MLTTTSRIVDEIAEAVATGDAARVAHQLGGIVANDDRVRVAIADAMGKSREPAGVLAAITAALSQ
jgi:serine phosphatase RsbU (regulator of sigma subunit)